MNINIHKELNGIIPVDEVTDGKIDPILWCRDGEYRIIPIEAIKNIMNLRMMLRQTESKIKLPVLVLTWSQGIPISNLAGRALVGE